MTDKLTYEELQAELADAKRKIAALERRNVDLLKRIEELERGSKRQAAPFSKGPPKANPKKPGRKKKRKKLWYKREVPEQVDETIEVALPEACPDCGGPVEPIRVATQYQTDIPPIKPITRCFRIPVCECSACGRRVQPRHPLQSSDALGAAGVQLGPNVLALGTLLNKGYGLSWEKVATFIGRAFGVEASRSTYCRAAVERLGPRAEVTYGELVKNLREAAAVYGDETGWKVAGEKAWLWVFTSQDTTVYEIDSSRGFDVASRVLGQDFSGLLGRDGWAPYRKFTDATHQSCLAHIFKRASDILKNAKQGAARLGHGIIRTLKFALDLREKRDEYSDHGFAVWRGRALAAFDRYLGWNPTYEPNAKFLKHLRRERPHLFTFLFHPEVEATNWPAEQAIRPAVVTRKMSGGNRSDRGARAQAILTSVIRTCGQRAVDSWDFLIQLLQHGDSRPILLPHPGG